MASKKKPKVIITPHYLLSRRYKRQYEGTSEVVSIMDGKTYDINNLIPLDTLHEMDFDEARNYIIKMKELFGSEKLKKGYNLSNYDFYSKFFKEYDIPTDRKKKGSNIKLLKQNEKPDNNQKNQEVISEDNIPKFNITLYGEFDGKELSERLVNIAASLFNGGKYNIYLKIEED